MTALAKQQGMKPTTLLTKNATRAKTLAALRAAAKALKAGDLFFLTFSGHGGQVPDVDGQEDEIDGRDETWCLYDGQLLDDELYLELSHFAAGVRILMLSDSCHSGTVAKVGPPSAFTMVSGPRPRWMPDADRRSRLRAEQGLLRQAAARDHQGRRRQVRGPGCGTGQCRGQRPGQQREQRR